LPWVVPIGSGTYDFIPVRTRHECLILPSVFFLFLLYSLCSPGGLHLKEGDNVTAARDLGPNKSHSILSSRHEP
jgi:hypothetical protein